MIAQGAVNTTTYSVTEIRHTSMIIAQGSTEGATYNYRPWANFRWTGPRGRNRVLIDFRRRYRTSGSGFNFVPGVARESGSAVYAPDPLADGTLVEPTTCNFRGAVPRAQLMRDVFLTFNTPRADRKRRVQIDLAGPDANARLKRALPGGLGRCLLPAMGPQSPGRQSPSARRPTYRTITVPQGKLRRAFRGRRQKVVVTGGVSWPMLFTNGEPAGRFRSTSRITMWLVKST